MEKNYQKIISGSVIISLSGVYVIDYFSHLLFSDPMETPAYFLIKAILYFVFSIIFLRFVNLDKNEFGKVMAGGIAVSLLLGFYYNIIPTIIENLFGVDFYPVGVALKGLTFLGMGLLGTGLAFGIVHTLAFVAGYYLVKVISKLSAPKIYE